jgi:hypothetical protein
MLTRYNTLKCHLEVSNFFKKWGYDRIKKSHFALDYKRVREMQF